MRDFESRLIQYSPDLSGGSSALSLRPGLEMVSKLRQKAGLEQVKGIDPLKRFPGFKEFYQEVLVPGILNNLIGNTVIVFNGLSGVGKETLAAMAGKVLEEDLTFQKRARKRGKEPWIRYLAFADALNAGKRISVVDNKTGEPLGYLIDPKKEHGYYNSREFTDAVVLIRKRILEAKRELRAPSIILLEIPGFPPNDFPPYLEMGGSVLETLASCEYTYFIGIVPDSKVQERATKFRTALEELKGLLVHAPTLEKRVELVERVLEEFRVRVGRNKVAEIAADLEKFRTKMGNARAVELTNELIDMWLYYLHQQKVYEQGIDVLKGARPESLANLQEAFRRDPDFRISSIERAMEYFYRERLRLPQGRFLVGKNSLFLDDMTHKELDVDFYREWVEQHALSVPLTTQRKDKKKFLGL